MIEASALVTGSFPVTFSTFALDLYPRQEQQLQEEGEAVAQDTEAAAKNGAEEEEIEVIDHACRHRGNFGGQGYVIQSHSLKHAAKRHLPWMGFTCL